MKQYSKLFAILLLTLVFSTSFCFANDKDDYFLSLQKKNVYPLDSDMGVLADVTTSEIHSFLYNALSQPFNFDWTETYFESKLKASLSTVYSPILSEILPASGFVMSNSIKNPDGTHSVGVKFSNGRIFTFTILDSTIAGIK